MTRLVKISAEAYAVVKGRADRECRTMVAVLGEAMGVGVRKGVRSVVSAGGAVGTADPSPLGTELKEYSYPSEASEGLIVAPPKRAARARASDAGGPEGVRPKGLSEKDWAIRKLKARRAEEREG